MTVRKLALASALVLATALAGCGKVGRLEPAAPMFGHKTKAAGAETPPPKQDPTRPIETVDPRDRGSVDPNPPAPPAPTPPTTRP